MESIRGPPRRRSRSGEEAGEVRKGVTGSLTCSVGHRRLRQLVARPSQRLGAAEPGPGAGQGYHDENHGDCAGPADSGNAEPPSD